MEQFELFSAPNPCIGVCENSPRGYCKGCMRNREERFNWSRKSMTEKLQIMKLCRRRYQRMLSQPTQFDHLSPIPVQPKKPTQDKLF